MKTCEVCKTEIPESYINLLCDKHYRAAKTGISDLDYEENPPLEELDLVSRIHGRFKGMGKVMPDSQSRLYHAIKDTFIKSVQENPQFPKFIWNPKVIDVGCGAGIGSNILSQRADFVWGIDKNEESINFAKQMFERTKNEIYYSSQVSFDLVDVENEPRELMKFDVVVCCEVIEHIDNFDVLLDFIKRVSKPKAVIYISTPNRGAWEGEDRAKKPLNEHHIREWTTEEFLSLLSERFPQVEILDCDLQPNTGKETPMVARIRYGV